MTMQHRTRRANYLTQPGGKRIHPLGSEGSLTAAQHRRLMHKMGHRKRQAIKRRGTPVS